MVNLKRISFKDRPDWIKGRYFLFTFPYGLFYIIGASLGYEKTRNLFCLLISGFCGILFLLLAVGHAIDFYRGVAVESFYVAIPFTISLFVAISMTCIWALGTSFVCSGIVALVAWFAVIFYLYAVAKDFGNGKKYRTYNNYEHISPRPMPIAPIPDFESSTGSGTIIGSLFNENNINDRVSKKGLLRNKYS